MCVNQEHNSFKGFVLNARCLDDKKCQYYKKHKANADKHMSWDPLEIEELQVPVLTEKNPLCPAFSEAAAIGFDPDKGRIVKARRGETSHQGT